ncbi:MAG: DUF2721 domain-containing protein [Stenotrophobium sp.]
MVDAQVSSIAHVIQLSVAPVFLIAGIGSTLIVLTNRLARIVDRARRLAGMLKGIEPEPAASLQHELAILDQRAHLIYFGIGCCTICALLICSVVVTLFVGASLNLNMAKPVALLFIGAMTAFICALLCFLREIRLAVNNLRIGLP